MTVLPVTTIRSCGTPSRVRLSFAVSVGAKCKSAMASVSLRFISSGKGA